MSFRQTALGHNAQCHIYDIMVNVVMLNVVVLSVMAPSEGFLKTKKENKLRMLFMSEN